LLRLIEQRQPLPRRGAQDLPARHQTLDAAIAWSYELLTAPEQELFLCAAVFEGGSTREAIEWLLGSSPYFHSGLRGDVGGGPGTNSLEIIASLAEKSLLQVVHPPEGGPRFHVRETVRTFALAQLRTSGHLETLRRRHAEYFLHLAEQSAREPPGRSQVEWFDRLEAEQENLSAVLTRNLRAGRDTNGRHDALAAIEAGLTIGGALGHFWRVRGNATEGKRWLEAFLEAAGAAGPGARTPTTAASIKALTEAGLLAITQHDWAAAESHFTMALSISEDAEDILGRGRALHGLGRLAAVQGDRERALSLFQASMALAEQAGDTYVYRHTVLFQGTMARYLGDLERAAQLYNQCLELCAAASDAWGTGFARFHLGHVAYARGDFALARTHFAASLHVFRSLRSAWGSVDALDGLVMVLPHSQPEVAARLSGATDTMRDAVGHPPLPADRTVYVQHLNTVRSALGDAAFRSAWSSGAALSLGAAVVEALRVVDEQATGRGAVVPGLRLAPALSGREREVLHLIAQGRSNRQIAECLVIAEPTAKFHVTSILNKLGANNRAQAVARAAQFGILDAESTSFEP
jgi:DNA-binding CsgD family transcriptional regulator